MPLNRLKLLVKSACLVILVHSSHADVALESTDLTASRLFSRLLQSVLNIGAPIEKKGISQSSGCGQKNWESGSYSMTHNDINRHFRVHIPLDYDSQIPTPLILVFHGWGGGDEDFLGRSIVREELDNRGYIMLAPLGLGAGESGRTYSSWSFRGSTTGLDGDGLNSNVVGDSVAICDDRATMDYTYPSCSDTAKNGCGWTHCLDDDLLFVTEFVKHAGNNLCVNDRRVYAVGSSNGGNFIWDLGYNPQTADHFAAVASIVGLPHRGYNSPPATENGIPTLLITGSRDRTAPPGGWDDPSFTTTSDGDVFYYESAASITRSWAEARGCDVSTRAKPVNVGRANFDCRGWDYCTGNTTWPTVLDCRSGMGHGLNLSESWPLVMDFFDKNH